MCKKGFTLIELLAVIVILGILLVIAIPNIINVINNAKNDAYEREKGLIIDAAQKYVLQNSKDIVWTNDIATIYLNDLQRVNLLDDPLKDPRGGNFNNTIPNGTRVKVTRNNNQYTYSIYAITGDDITTPVITLQGSNPVTIGQGEVYNDAGATATDDTDGDITSKLIVTNNVDTGTVGSYTVVYNVTDKAGNNTTISRTVNVILMYADNSGANAPVLFSNMIPVKWNGTAWVKADVNNRSGTNSWYDYDNKIWANAVTVTSTNRATYQGAVVGTPILESDILTYHVWIPRYKYRIPSGTGPRTIDIVFESTTTTKSTGNAVSTYLTHPAFTFFAKELSGIWVGKFETTGTTSAITIKPNITSLRNVTVSTAFNATRAMQNASNSFGFPTTGMDIHMMKNTEWGSVVFLSHSKYGINGEVWINPNSNYITGCAGDNASATSTTICNTYDSTNGIKASTTGNIYGIYDMSGGSWEYVMGKYSGYWGVAGFSSYPNGNYYNDYSTTTTFKGDACNADGTNGWYGDYASFTGNVSYPWLGRGGANNAGATAGIFYYAESNGGAGANTSFRTTVAPTT